MTRFWYWWRRAMLTMMIVLTMRCYYDFVIVPARLAAMPAPEVLETRGPKEVLEPAMALFIAQTEALRMEEQARMPMLLLMWLQAPSGVTVSGEIPIWGVFLVLLGAVGAFFALRQQLNSHERAEDARFATHEHSDDQRFNEIHVMLKEIRDDIKKLIGGET